MEIVLACGRTSFAFLILPLLLTSLAKRSIFLLTLSSIKNDGGCELQKLVFNLKKMKQNRIYENIVTK
jgi:hypothetical protein